MSRSVEADDRDEVERLADDYVARHRLGESPSIEEYVGRCPDRAQEIRDLFPAIAAMERIKPRPTPKRDPAKLICERLGDCRLIREIGRGGMGIVYEAEQESLGRRVAVKVLPHAPWADDRPMQRFLRESRTAASLRHGNIVPVFGVGEDHGLHYYLMPLIPGLGLDRVLRALHPTIPGDLDPVSTFPDDSRHDVARSLARTLIDGSLVSPVSGGNPSESTAPRIVEVKPRFLTSRKPSIGKNNLGPDYWRGVARIGVQVADALQHAHDQGVLHRDIKPANLLLDHDGVVWVTDFGLAKALGHADLSRTGDFVGTLRYMAPERLKGECDPRSDLYSLGLTLYEFLAFRAAYEAPDGAELVRKIAESEPIPPRSWNPDVPIDLETIILKAIEPEPRRRYASANAFSNDLSRYLDGQPIIGRRLSRPEKWTRWVVQNRTLTTLAGTSIVLGIVAAIFLTLFLLAPPRQPPFGQEFDPPLDRPPPPGWQLQGPPPKPNPPPLRKRAF